MSNPRVPSARFLIIIVKHQMSHRCWLCESEHSGDIIGYWMVWGQYTFCLHEGTARVQWLLLSAMYIARIHLNNHMIIPIYFIWLHEIVLKFTTLYPIRFTRAVQVYKSFKLYLTCKYHLLLRVKILMNVWKDGKITTLYVHFKIDLTSNLGINELLQIF